MTKINNTANQPKLNILKSEVFQGISIEMQNESLNQIPWIISVRITVKEAIKQLDSVALNTLFVVNDENRLVGVITKNPAIAKGCKPGSGGMKGCQDLCNSKCANRGGCAFICWNPWGKPKCVYDCNDQFDDAQDQSVGETWF